MKDDELHFEQSVAPSESDLAIVDQGLHAFNLAAADLDAVKPAACFVRDSAGRLIGGARARTWGSACELQQLWVDAAWRRRGIGLQLLELIERLVRDRGCETIYLDTFSWQAPRLYRRAGFVVACELRGFPDGATRMLMVKALAANDRSGKGAPPIESTPDA